MSKARELFNSRALLVLVRVGLDSGRGPKFVTICRCDVA